MILCMVLVGTPNLLSQNLLARIVLLHMMEVTRDLYNLFLETLAITYMHIGWFFAIQPQIRW